MSETTERGGCLGILMRVFGASTSEETKRRRKYQRRKPPYRLRPDFLSPAELAFYTVLQQAVGQSYAINNKVRMGDLLYVPRDRDSRKYENKVSSKHVDFLLCDSTTMQPLLGD
ncbi:MAG: DUF2726 domain-containing protein [Pirellulaceae bacterium]